MADASEIDSVTAEDDLSKTREELFKVWEKNMHDFVPEDMVTFIVNHNTALVFKEEIVHTKPTEIKGAYYVNSGADAEPLSGVIV